MDGFTDNLTGSSTFPYFQKILLDESVDFFSYLNSKPVFKLAEYHAYNLLILAADRLELLETAPCYECS